MYAIRSYYDKIKLAQDRLRDARSRSRAELSGLEMGLGDEQGLIEELEVATTRLAEATRRAQKASRAKDRAAEELTQEQPVWARMVQVRESVLSMHSELRVAERDVAEARRDFERLDKELAEALDASYNFV